MVVRIQILGGLPWGPSTFPLHHITIFIRIQTEAQCQLTPVTRYETNDAGCHWQCSTAGSFPDSGTSPRWMLGLIALDVPVSCLHHSLEWSHLCLLDKERNFCLNSKLLPTCSANSCTKCSGLKCTCYIQRQKEYMKKLVNFELGP